MLCSATAPSAVGPLVATRSSAPGTSTHMPSEEAPDPNDLQELMERVRAGDEAAPCELFRSVQDQLHALAARQMANQPPGHTLQPTALVNEAYLRLSKRLDRIEDRTHFLRVAAKAMRQILVDHGRRRSAEKRIPRERRVAIDVALDGTVQAFEQRANGLEDLDEALAKLESVDESLARLVELRFFAGQTIEACAEVLGVSERQAYRWWQSARAFLHREMTRGSERDE